LRPFTRAKTGTRSIAIAALLLASLPAAGKAAAGDAEGEGWRTRSRLTGDWGGARDALEARGVDLYAQYTAGFWSNVHGGFDTGTRYEGFARWGVDADLGPLLGWEGGRVHLGMISYHGGQPSTELVGAFSSTFLSGWEAEVFARFYEIFFEQQWLDGQLLVRGGQLTADDDFFISEYAASLVNATFGYLGIARLRQIGPFYPIASPGVYVAAKPGAGWFGRVGAYVSDVGEDESGNLGFDWGFSQGGFFMGEVGTERRPFGRPGRYLVGIAGTTSSVVDFSTASTAGGQYGIYGLIDQALLMSARGRPKLGSFLRFELVPEKDMALVHWYVDGGLELRSPLPRRVDDALSFGVAYVRFGRDYLAFQEKQGENGSAYQLSFDLAYRARVTPWLTLQPDLQYFVEPHLSRRNAFAIGLRAVIDL